MAREDRTTHSDRDVAAGQRTDVDVREAVRYPEPPSELKRFSIPLAIKMFGPGAIVASITIGSGETVFSSRAGAIFGYTIIWAFVAGAILKAAAVYAQNRYMTVTGEHPMTRWAHLFPGPKGWFPLVIGVISVGSFPFWAGGLATFIGDFLAQWTGGATFWAIGLLLILGIVAFTGGYEWMERAQQILIAAMMLAVLAAVIVANPDWLATLGGLIPRLPAYDAWVTQEVPALAGRPVWIEVVTFLGALGGGTYDYIGYTGMLREKKWGMLGHGNLQQLVDRFTDVKRGEQLPIATDEESVRRSKAWSLAPLGDVVASFTVMSLFGIAFLINGANILHAQRQVPAEDQALQPQVQFLEVIHPALSYLYYFGVIAAFTGTLYGLWEVYSFTAYETVGGVFDRVRHAGIHKARLWVYPYVFLGGLALILTGWDPVTIVTWAAILGGVLTVGLFALAVLWTERRVLPEPLRLKGVAYWLALVAGVALTVFGIISILQQLGVIPSAAT